MFKVFLGVFRVFTLEWVAVGSRRNPGVTLHALKRCDCCRSRW